jgi:hypothetical protein
MSRVVVVRPLLYYYHYYYYLLLHNYKKNELYITKKNMYRPVFEWDNNKVSPLQSVFC